jgi:hypothetical protein
MTVYLFFDESGNLDFSNNGTPHYIFGCLTTRDPASLLRPLADYRYELLGEGVEIEAFHATSDRQVVRNRVFDIIAGTAGLDFDCVIIEKRKVNPSLYDEARFYPQFANYLLRYVFRRYTDPNEWIVVITDRLPMKRKREAVEKAFKTYIKQNLGSRPFSIVHHSSAGHSCLQAADYCTWAIYKKWHDRELRPYNVIKPMIRSEFDILQSGTDRYY